jgi:hypothetical protein
VEQSEQSLYGLEVFVVHRLSVDDLFIKVEAQEGVLTVKRGIRWVEELFHG